MPPRIRAWPVLRQLISGDRLGLRDAARSSRTESWRGRIEDSDRVVRSICPYCAVGCGQRVFVKADEITQIEGDPDSPISRGRLCPKGAASRALVGSPRREYRVKYRRPYGSRWEDLSLDQAMDMIADRVIATRDATWEEKDDKQELTLKRTLGFGHLGGATLDIEENYLLKKLYTALGAIQIENQARI